MSGRNISATIAVASVVYGAGRSRHAPVCGPSDDRQLDAKPTRVSTSKENKVKDPTEALRREIIATGQPYRDLAQAQQRWTTDQLREEFEVLGFLAPFVAVVRKSDGVEGSMEFSHDPRFYFNFVGDLK